MKPEALVSQVELDLAAREEAIAMVRAALVAFRDAMEGLHAAFGLSDGSLSIAITARARGKKGKRVTRAAVRRGRARAARALRTKAGRRRAVPAGSLTDRIMSVLNEYAAPMSRGRLVDQVKAPIDAVLVELKRLRADGLVVMVGERAGARYAVPKFANVVVAQEFAEHDHATLYRESGVQRA